MESPIGTARQGTEVRNSEHGRIDPVFSVLEKYKVAMGTLQEGKWFGIEVYLVGEALVLKDGRSISMVGHVKQRVFGSFQKALFLDMNLPLYTKRIIYDACILSVLLYGSECLISLRKHI